MIDKLTLEIYRDSSQPSVQAVGRALGTVFELANTFLLPIREGQEKRKARFRHNMEKFRKTLAEAEANEKTVLEASPEIGVPIVEKLTYLSEDALSDLFC